MKPVKLKKCKQCGDDFEPFQTMQKVCGPVCAISYAKEQERIKKEKQDRAEIREMKKRLKTKRDYLKDAQKEFNWYIANVRDKNAPCISCGTTKPDIQYCAGHYKTVGAHSELRFNEDNVHRQCNRNCNMGLSGNIQGYRPALIEKIGLDRVEALENSSGTLDLSIEEIEEIRLDYKERNREERRARARA